MEKNIMNSKHHIIAKGVAIFVTPFLVFVSALTLTGCGSSDIPVSEKSLAALADYPKNDAGNLLDTGNRIESDSVDTASTRTRAPRNFPDTSTSTSTATQKESDAGSKITNVPDSTESQKADAQQKIADASANIDANQDGLPDIGYSTWDVMPSTPDIGSAPDIFNPKDSYVPKDSYIQKDSYIPSAPDMQVNKPDIQNNQPDVPANPPIPPKPSQVSKFVAGKDGNTWYNNTLYNYMVKFPTALFTMEKKDGDIIFSGNAQDKKDFTPADIAKIPNFTIDLDYQAKPDYVSSFNDWYKELYGKPDEVVTYQGKTFKFHSADSGGGFNRFTYVPIGLNGVLRVEINFSMPPEKFVNGFEEKVLNSFYMITSSASELILSL